MYAPINTTALFVRLKDRPELQAKALELRDRVATYLRGVDASFSHFTSHAVDHSDQIVRELSAMLFDDQNDQATISVDLNHTETYMLIQAIYLHDVGMVVTDKEKYEILKSEAWRQFTLNNEVIGDVEKLKVDLGAALVADQDLFVAALEQKLQLSDFFRTRHADRARGAINGALRVVEDFLASDPSAGSTITAICVGHGLSSNELTSEASYPTRRDHFGEPVNVRLLTILVRLGDLLDMRSERACPLMYSIVSPLPRSSEVHWAQYDRIVSRVTSPSQIALTAECESAEEHRLLLDWCTWLAAETAAAPRLLGGGARHARWIAPNATVGDSHSTIQILRAPGARYRAEDWKFQFDENEIVLRLVRDVHRGNFGFLRELIQNALDTTRARALLESTATHSEPHLLTPELRSKYPISIILSVSEEGVESITVADRGLGMTTDIVKNYFLQIGRSWYRSTEFARDFSFNATSQFGIGFLSVFAVSDDVEVDTRWHGDPPESALSMKLPGPKNHLLFEDAFREEPGTTVMVRLREPAQLQALLEFLELTCLANEFDIVVTSDPQERLPECHFPQDRTNSSDVQFALENSTLSIHKIASSTEGVYGHLGFLICTSSEAGQEDWSLTDAEVDAMVTKSNPLAEFPTLERSWVALNGLSSSELPGWYGRSQSVRWEFDVRLPNSAGEAGLDREQIGLRIPWSSSELSTALDEHLSDSVRDFPYVARLQERFKGLEPGWAQAVPIFETLDGDLISVNDTRAGAVFLALHVYEGYRYAMNQEREGADKKERLAALRRYQFDDQEKRTIVLSGRTGYMSLSNIEEISSRMTGLIREVSSDLLLVEISAKRTTVGLSDLRMLTGKADSDLVRFTFGLAKAVVNTTHPLVSAILEVPDKHKAARARLLMSLRSPAYDRDLKKELAAVGAALDSPVLLRYADLLRNADGFRSNFDLRLER